MTQNEEFLEILVSSLDAYMGEKEQADTARIKEIIKSAISGNKIGLEGISKDLVDFIEKHKSIKIEIPSLNFQAEIDKDVLKTYPLIFKWIDDVLVGNNIFFIGEAGSGKTAVAERIANILDRSIQIINCSQYTSPIDIIGGQTIDGYVDGKLVTAWRNGEILILDEMPKLDSNTAGLLNDALARSNKILTSKDRQFMRSARASEPPIPMHPNFAVIATGNIYPNMDDTIKYVGNNKQDLSLLDRFSGSVYRIDFDKNIDQNIALFDLIYDFTGNTWNKIDGGLRGYMMSRLYTNYAVVSARTIGALKVALLLEIQNRIDDRNGKTVKDTFESYLTAFSPEIAMNIAKDVDVDSFYLKIEMLVKTFVSGGMDMVINPYLTDFYKNGKEIKLSEIIKR